jgi:hypothetical protein
VAISCIFVAILPFLLPKGNALFYPGRQSSRILLWYPAADGSHLLIFSLCSHTTPDMAFPFVLIQDFPYLQIQRIVALSESNRQCLVNRRLGNAELLCHGADSGTGFNHVHSQLTGARFWIFSHGLPSDAVLLKNPMLLLAQICSLDSWERKG